uniref:Putative secreted peptide n=1 Tax=Anopheles braziliensis TaxID=58242 RepID=A0A2M3ZQE2_9DIPT
MNRNRVFPLVLLVFCGCYSLLWSQVAHAGATTSSLSGIYVDNGVGQTVLEDTLTIDEQQEIENEILNLLGLPGPRPAVRHLHSSVSKSAPQFLLNVYDQLQQDVEEEEEKGNGGTGGYARSRKVRSISSSSDILITEADRKAIDESDIIMTFLNKINQNTNLSKIRSKFNTNSC